MSSTNRGSEYRENGSYYTPLQLTQVLVPLLPIKDQQTILEPSVGHGSFLIALDSYLKSIGIQPNISCIDIDPDAPGLEIATSLGYYASAFDFLNRKIYYNEDPGHKTFDWIIGNPPYAIPIEGRKKPLPVAELHVRRALELGHNVAFLLRLAFLETKTRIPFWRDHPARKVWVLAERPDFTGDGGDSCAYGFFWWDNNYKGPTELEIISWDN